MSTPKKTGTDWGALSSRQGSRREDPTTPPAPEDAAQLKVNKSYRLSPRAVRAVDAGQLHLMNQGERASREIAVERAILAAYGHLLPEDD